MRGWSKGRLSSINYLRRLPARYLDKYGEPLFRDLSSERYLAPDYPSPERALLGTLGLKIMTWTELLNRFQNDLRLSNSRYKAIETPDHWHTRVAELCGVAFKENMIDVIGRLKKFDLIPMPSGVWGSIASGEIFFPETEGMLIPTDLALRIMTPNALHNPARKEFYEELGVKPAPVKRVRDAIFKQYTGVLAKKVHTSSSVKHLQYLYWTSPTDAENERLRPKTSNGPLSLWIFNHRGQAAADNEDVYFPTDDAYGFQKLVGSLLDELHNNQASIGSFIHPEYLEYPPTKPDIDQHSWETWLEESVSILRRPRLADMKDPTRLSDVFRYIVKSQSDKLLGTLKAHWNAYSALMNPGLISEISKAEVPDTNLGRKALNDTYVPFEDLTARCSEFLDVNKFPFLKLDELSHPGEWSFLEIFSVGLEDTLDFYLQILCQCKSSNSPFCYDLYEAIQQKIWASKKKYKDMERVWYVM